MQEVFYNFFIRFLHPLRVHDFLYKTLRYGTLNFIEKLPVWPGKFKLRRTTFGEVVLISWIFVLIHTIYSVNTMNVGLQIVKFFEKSDLFVHFFSGHFILMKFFSLFSIIVNAAIFPLYAFFYQKFWIHIIGLFLDLYNMKKDNKAIEEVVNSSFVANTFLIIPVFGSFFRNIAAFFFLFAGFRRNLKMDIPQAVLLLSTPLLSLLIFAFLLILWFISVMVLPIKGPCRLQIGFFDDILTCFSFRFYHFHMSSFA